MNREFFVSAVLFAKLFEALAHAPLGFFKVAVGVVTCELVAAEAADKAALDKGQQLLDVLAVVDLRQIDHRLEP